MKHKSNYLAILKLFVLVTLVAVLILPTQRAQAATCTSIVDGLWSDTGTWSAACGGVIPTALDDVVIATAVNMDTAGVALSLTINSGGTLTFSGANSLTVSGNVTINSSGALILGSGGATGDLYLTGNWSRSGTFTAGGRAVVFNGSGTQTVNTMMFANSFAYLTLDKPSGNLQLTGRVAINGTSGNVLDLLQSSGIDLNNQTMVISGTLAGGSTNIRVCGGSAHTIGGGAGSTFLSNSIGTFNKNVTTTGCGAAGTLIFGSNVMVQLSGAAALDNKFDPGSGLTTINGTLKISFGGQVINNSPTYGPASTLNYDTGNGYTAGTEWVAGTSLSTPGVPFNVLISTDNTDVGLLAGSIPTCLRTVMGDFTLGGNGTLRLSTSANCNLTVKGSWWNYGGTLTPYSRIVIFDSATDLQVIGGGAPTTFWHLTINNTNDVMLGWTTAVNGILRMQAGKFDLDFYNLTIGSTGSITFATGGASTARMLVADDAFLCKIFTGSSSYTFLYPIGDHQDPDDTDTGDDYLNYTPFNLALPAGDYNTYDICTSTRHKRQSAIPTSVTTDYLFRYWRVTTTGEGVGTFNGTFNYDGRAYSSGAGDTGDVVGTEGNMYRARYDWGLLNWITLAVVDTVNHNFTYGTAMTPMLDQADYTALPGPPLAVNMVNMRAVRTSNGVQVRWTTTQETNTVGFNVYRSTTPDGARTLLTSDLIPAQSPGALAETDYQYEDLSAQPGVSYYYWIEEIDTAGSTFFGPLQATNYFFHLPLLLAP